MNAQRLLHAIDEISYWSGKAFAWLIVALTFVVSIEVFKRYIFNAPTSWIFDLNNMLYGTLFMMCGAYTLALAGHVRADFVYIYLQTARPGGARSRACIFCFFSQVSSGLSMRAMATPLIPRIAEHSMTAEGRPSTTSKQSFRSQEHLSCFRASLKSSAVLFAFALAPGRRAWTMWKKLTLSRPNSPTASTWTQNGSIPIAKVHWLMLSKRPGRDYSLHRVPDAAALWPVRLADVEEIDVIDTQLSHSEYVDEESRRVAMETAHAVDEAARHRSVMEESVVHEVAIKEDEQKKS